jgi:O-antigen/teichoic acid export membrane protein
MSRRRATAAAVAGSVWTAALGLAAVPVYLSRLGIEAFGLIGFFMTAQAVLQALDLGLAPMMNREAARNTATGDVARARVLLRTLARMYWCTAAAIALVFWAAAPAIATAWLDASKMSSRELADSLALMGLLIAVRWPIALYQNALLGAQRLGTASALSALAGTLSVAASVAVVTWLWPRPQALFVTQAVVSLLHAIAARQVAWRALGGRGESTADFGSLRGVWRFGAGMGGVAITGIALTQLDKALLSKMLPLAAFGEYMLAVTAVGGLAVCLTPLFNTIFPDFTARVARGQSDELTSHYQQSTQVFAILYLPIVAALGWYAQDLVWAWTGQRETAAAVAPIIAVLCIGSAINGLMYFPYSLQLAHGLSRIPLTINTALLVLTAPAVVVLARKFGAMGGAMAWAGLQLVYLFVGSHVTHRRIAIGSAAAWLTHGVALPVAATLALLALMHPVVVLAAPGSAARIGLICASVAITWLVCAACLRAPRSSLLAGMLWRAS